MSRVPHLQLIGNIQHWMHGACYHLFIKTAADYKLSHCMCYRTLKYVLLWMSKVFLYCYECLCNLIQKLPLPSMKRVCTALLTCCWHCVTVCLSIMHMPDSSALPYAWIVELKSLSQCGGMRWTTSLDSTRWLSRPFLKAAHHPVDFCWQWELWKHACLGGRAFHLHLLPMLQRIFF